MPRSRYVLLGLFGIGLLHALLYYTGITLQYPLSKGLYTPRATWPQLVDVSLVAGLRHAVVYGLLIAAYMLALRLAVRIPPRCLPLASSVIVGGWLVFCLVLLRAYPGDSLDIFDYVFRGRMQVLFHVSPLATTPDAYRGLPFYEYLTWGDWVDAYGPLWEYPSALVAHLVGTLGAPTLANYIIGYRLLAITLTTISAGIMCVIMRRRAPQFIPATLVAWLWNPLLVISVTVGAHNDGMLIVLILLAVLLFQRQRFTLGLIALVLAAQVKITALVLLPVFGLWVLRRRGVWRAAATSASTIAIIFPVSWLLYAHYGGWATLPRMVRERAILTYNSLANVAFDQLRIRWQVDETVARQLAIRGASLGFVVVAALLLLVFWFRSRQQTDDATLWRFGIGVIVAYLVVGCFWFQSWYVVWPLVLAALLPTEWLAQTLLPLFAAGALWSNIVTDFLNQDRAHHFSGPQIDALMVVTLLLPPLLAVLWRWAHRSSLLRISRWRMLRVFNPTLKVRN